MLNKINQEPRPEQSEQPEQPNLIADLVSVFDAVKEKLIIPDYDLKKVDTTFPDPHDLKGTPVELLELYLQLAVADVENLKKSGSAGLLAAMKAKRGVIAQAEVLLQELQNREDATRTATEKKDTEEVELSPLQKMLQKLGIGLDTETAFALYDFDTSIKTLVDFIKRIGTQDYDPRTYYKERNLLEFAQSIQAKILVIRAEIDVSQNEARTKDPIGFRNALGRFDFAFTGIISEIVDKFQKKVDSKILKEETQKQKDKEENRVPSAEEVSEGTAPLLVSELMGQSSAVSVKRIRKQLGLAEQESDQENKSIISDRKKIKTIITRLDKTVEPLKIDIENYREKRDALFSEIKTALSKEGKLGAIDLESGFSEENVIKLRGISERIDIILLEEHRLSLLIGERTMVVENLNIVLQWAYRLRGESKIEIREGQSLDVVKQIYADLREKAVPKDIKLRLPENFDELFELEQNAAYERLALAIVLKIEEFYVTALSGSGTIFQFHKGSIDLWSNDKMFMIASHDAHDVTSFQFFLENFPWERFLPKDRLVGENADSNIASIRAYARDLWKYRIFAIQNGGNAAAGIENLWRGNEHGTYHEKVFEFIAEKGSGGGNLSWDMGPYHHHVHRAKRDAQKTGAAAGELLFCETFGKREGENMVFEEDDWLLPEYENFILRQIHKRYNEFNYNNAEVDVANLTTDLTKSWQDDEKFSKTILSKLKKQVLAKFGVDISDTISDPIKAQEILNREQPKIDLATKKAIWTWVHTLKMHEADKGAIHTKLSRYLAKTYFRKIFSTGVSAVRWRPRLAVALERAYVPLETMLRLNINLVTHDGKPIYDEVQQLQYESNDEDYIRWLVDLKDKSVDHFTNINSVAEYQELIKIRDGLFGSQLTEAQKEVIKRKLSEGEKLIGVWSMKKLGPEEQRKNLLVQMKSWQKQLDDADLYIYLDKLVTAITKELIANPTADKKTTIRRAASTFAIDERYLIIRIKPEHTGLGVAGQRMDSLPVAIPRERLIRNAAGRIIGARKVPFQAIRDTLVSTSPDFVDFSTFPKLFLQTVVGLHGESAKWFKMLDLTDSDAIFAPIHNQDIQDKARGLLLPSQEIDDISFVTLEARMAIINFSKGFKKKRDYTDSNAGSSEVLSNEEFEALLLAAGEDLETTDEVQTVVKDSSEVIREKTFKLGVDLHRHLKKRVRIQGIQEYELVSVSEKPGENAPGLGFPKVVQYAAQYLFGKTPDKLILLEMFRENCKDLARVIEEESRTPAKDAAKNIEVRTHTAVPDFLRKAIDLYLEGEESSRKLNGLIKGQYEAVDKLKEEIKDFYRDLEETTDEVQKTEIQAEIDIRKSQVKAIESDAEYKKNKNNYDYAKSQQTRAEKEIVVGLFWLAVDAYLDPYAFDIEFGDNLSIPITQKGREMIMKEVKTVSGVKPMNFVDRELLIAYVQEMLNYFRGSNFGIGNSSPTNVLEAEDVYEMMKRKGIIGSTQQILVDMNYYSGGGFKSLIAKSESSSK